MPQVRGNGRQRYWTGTEMVIWGGYNNIYLNTGSKYNFGSGYPWTTLQQPSQQQEVFHTAIWTGTKMVIWGGPGTLLFRRQK